MTEEWKAKIVAAQEAVVTAASLLLEHAEGLGVLAVMESNWSAPIDLREAACTPSLYPPGGPAWGFLYAQVAEDRAWATVKAAVGLAAAREEQQQAAVMMGETLRGLREAVEEVIGPEDRPPPPVWKIAMDMGKRHPGVRPEAVHRQAWLNYLVAAAKAAHEAKP